MGFDEGRIVLDSDNGAYYSGQTVSGKLVFDQAKVKTFRGIYVKIKGFCQVHWTSTNNRRVPDGQGGYRSETYTEAHESHEVYIERKIYLVGGESGEHRLSPGKHSFPFSFPLPHDCPSSFEGEYGHVRYELKAVVDRAFKMDQEKKIVLRVCAPLDLNEDPYCNRPIEMEFRDAYCCCCVRAGVCATRVRVPRGGGCPGQAVPVHAECANDGNVDIDTISFAIEQHITYHATHHPGTKSTEDTIAKLKKGPVPGNNTRSWTVQMEVPTMDLYNVNSCKYIDIEYMFKVTVCPSGCHENSKESRPFVIGTIPLRGSQDGPALDQMPVPNLVSETHQMSPSFGPVVNQPMPNVTPYPYPGASSPYPGANPPYPGANSPYPGASSPYPGANPPYPGANPPYANGMSPYPANPPYPAGTNPTFPGANSPYTNASSPHPANVPYPTGNSPYPVPNAFPGASPYPNAPGPSPSPAPYPGGAPPPAQFPGFSAAPALPPGASVPYPTGPASPFASASAPGMLAETPDDNTKNTMDVGPSSPYNPNFKG